MKQNKEFPLYKRIYGITDEGTELAIEQRKRLFCLPTTISHISGGDKGWVLVPDILSIK